MANRVIIDYKLKDLVADDPEAIPAKGDFIVICPYCRDIRGKLRRKLYIKTDYSVGHCWCCESVYHNPETKPDDIFEGPIFRLPKAPKVFTEVNSVDVAPYTSAAPWTEEGQAYLQSRPDYCIATDYNRFGIKFTRTGVIIPIRYRVEVPYHYYQVRYYDPSKHVAKYFMPTIANKPFNMIQRGTSRRAVLVEGNFGAFAIARANPNDTVIALLGKILTDYHAWLLGQFDFIDDYLIFLDETELSTKLAKQIVDFKLPYNTISIVPSTGFDPDEAMRDNIALTKQQLYPVEPVRFIGPRFK